jgi:hypothetical protein
MSFFFLGRYMGIGFFDIKCVQFGTVLTIYLLIINTQAIQNTTFLLKDLNLDTLYGEIDMILYSN